MHQRFSNPFVNVVLILLCSLAVALIYKVRPAPHAAEASIQPATKHHSQKRYIQPESPVASTTGTTDITAPSIFTPAQSSPSRTRSLPTTQTSGTAAPLSDRENSNHPVQKILARRVHSTSRTAPPTTEVLEIRTPESLGSMPDPISLAVQESQPPPTALVEEAKLPIALALPESTVNQLSPQEQSAIQRVQESFTQDISVSPSQDPETPEYFSYWKSAQARQDEQLRITLGWDRFNRLSALAAQQSPSPSP
jgi:hypothetical protein